MDDDLPESGDRDETLLGIDLRRYLDALRKYAWAVLAIIALGVTAAVIYTNRQPRIYQASASVQIEPRVADYLGQGQEILVGVATAGSLDYYKQQRKVLSSYSLIKQTVQQPALASDGKQGPPLYTLLVSEDQRKDVPLDRVIEWATGIAQGMLSIHYPEQDRTMYVVATHRDPSVAARVANTHVATYVDHAKGELRTDTQQASTALSSAFDDVEKKLQESEASLLEYQNKDTVPLEEQQKMVASGITTYTLKLNDARARRIELTARLDRMRKAATMDVLTSPVLMIGDTSDHGAFDSLRAQYYQERNKFIELEKEFGPKTHEYQMQKAKVDDIHAALTTESTRMMRGLEEQVEAQLATETALKSEISRLTNEAKVVGEKVPLFKDLERKRKSLQDRYDILRSRLSTSELTDRMNRKTEASNVSPLDPALVPTASIYPNLKKNVVAAGVLSLLLGLGLVFLVVLFDRSIKTTQDATQATGSPVLGVIPMIDPSELAESNDGNRDLYVHKNPGSRVAECCRSLRTNIMFSGADRPLKTLVVSSANPREGKTTTVMYLGTTIAQSGQRVLLIDTDMRRPRLHASTGVSRQTGLTNLIVGDHAIEDVIKTTEIPNLYILPCGPTPPNPAELLMTQRFQSVLAELVSRFDRVILDSPPLGVVTDAVVLSKHTDGVILVAKAGATLRDDLKRASRQVRDVQGTIIGTIVNAIVPDQRSGYYYSYYGYSESQPEPNSQST